jgi:antitoxin component YwqK of YwqJK toxin-antitoxin module
MKSFFYCLLVVFLPVTSKAQVATDTSASIPTVIINAQLIGQDSVIIPFNDRYNVVQDACTQIVRYGHYNFQRNYFYGKFKDVKKDDPSIIIVDGTYTNDGLKDGLFNINYLNGQLMAHGIFKTDKFDGEWVFYYPDGKLKAKGYFKDDNYYGKWEMYYETGQPKLFFESKDGICKITNAWTPDGEKNVSDGNGNYQTESKDNWGGKLTNGLPDSIWAFQSSAGNRTLSIFEYFKGNKFLKGYIENGDVAQSYKDASHIILSPQLPELPFEHGQYLDINATCDDKQLNDVYIKIFNRTLHRKYKILTGAKSY